MKYIILLFIFQIHSVCVCQVESKITSNSMQSILIDFLSKKGDINDFLINELRNNNGKIQIRGALNGYSKNNLIDGVYFFSAPITHTRTYYVLIDSEKYIILDLSNEENFINSVTCLLSFCDKKKYCSEIIRTYISGMTSLYYRNKNSIKIIDENCISGINITKDFP